MEEETNNTEVAGIAVPLPEPEGPSAEDPRDSQGPGDNNENLPEEPDNDEAVLNNQDVWKDYEGKIKAGTETAKKTGVLAWVEETTKSHLVGRALDIHADMNKKGTEASKALYVWEEMLTPEGRDDFLKGNGLVHKMLTALYRNTLPMFAIAEEAWHLFKRKTFDAENLGIKDFNPEVIQMYCSLGLLSCTEEQARSIDSMAAKGLKVGAKALKALSWVALAIPGVEEASPILDKGAKGAALLSQPAEWAANLMPKVRAEVKQRIAEVPETLEGTHEGTAYAVQPPVHLHPGIEPAFPEAANTAPKEDDKAA